MQRIACAILLAAAAAGLAGCPKSSHDFDEGRKAETLNDYDTALVHFERALKDQPGNSEYRLRAIQARMQDAQFHVEQGRKALDAGDLQMALAEFQRAQAVDASNSAADQGVKQAMDAIAARSAPRPSANQISPTDQDADLLTAPPQLKPLNREPINLKMTNDTRVIYETIAKLANLSVVFDPNMSATRRISIDLPNVSLEQALDIVSQASQNFWKPLTPSVILVAPDNQQRRRDVEDQEVRTFYLSNTVTAADLNEIVTSLRQLLEMRRVQAVTAQNAIIIRDTPDRLALAAKIINDADRAKPEVLIHVQILTANVDRLRNLGILPGQTATVTFTPSCSLQGAAINCNSGGSSSGSSSTPSAPASIPLNQLKNLSTADYSITLPGATATAILTDNKTKVIQDPQVRVSDGEKATLNVGEKIPIATGSFQAGVGVSTTSVSPLVNTQFTQQDVGVKIVVTPRVHPNGDVSLNLSVIVSALAGTTNIGGIDQPIISNHEIDHDVRLKDGEVSVLGGLIERTETKNLNGIPGMAQLPLLKYLFSDNKDEIQENEVLIVTTPHVIRFPSIEAANLQTVASGTDTNARVFRTSADPMSSVAPSSNTAPANPQQPGSTGSLRPAPGTSVQPNAPGAVAPGATAQLQFQPASVSMKVGDTTTIGLSVAGVNDLYSIPLLIHYNPSVLQVQEVRDGGFLSGGTQEIAIVQRIDQQNGQVIVNATRQPNTPGVNGAGTIIGLVVRAIGPGSSPLQVLQVNGRDSQQRPIPMVSGEATIQVQ